MPKRAQSLAIRSRAAGSPRSLPVPKSLFSQALADIRPCAPSLSGVPFRRSAGINWGMTTLTRRRDPQSPNETWRLYFGDVQAGTIAKPTEGPTGSPAWQ